MSSKKLSSLLKSSLPDVEILGLQYDSRKVQKGDLFVAVPGFKEDGAVYLSAAFAAGAVAAVISDQTKVPAEFQNCCVVVPDVRKTMADLAYRFYDCAVDGMNLFGVTGTKGKTSTVYLLESVLREAGKTTALLGTVECRHPGGAFPSTRTTMDSIDLQKFFAYAKKYSVNAVAMEVSSHALSLHRVRNCHFQGAIFTNLQPDHLDFYSDMEAYFQAKQELFELPYFAANAVAAINTDCEYGRRLLAKHKGDHFVSFGLERGDVHAEKIELSSKGIHFLLKVPGQKDGITVQSRLVGEFNLQNILGVCALSWKLGFPLEKIAAGIAALKNLPGRMEEVATTLPFSVFVDFAHMGPALDNVLQTLRKSCKGKLIVVFGAGGDKDPQRRVQLGQVAAKRADFSVITSDNPRTEDPAKIMAAIEKSYCATRAKGDHSYCVQPDRRLAIRQALEMASSGDIICLAGKGHEIGQIVGAQVFPFDDREEARIVLRELELRVDSSRKS